MEQAVVRENEKIADKALSFEQLLKYADDLVQLFEAEQEKREALESTNKKLQREITERRALEKKLVESEKKYRSLFEDSGDAIYIMTRDGRLVDANRSCIELFGYTKEEFGKMNVLEIHVDPSMPKLFQREMEQKGFIRDWEVKLCKKDGTIMDCLMTSTLHKGEDRSKRGYHVIVRDITDRKRLEEVLHYARKMEALSQMGGGIAHEIRNPLAIASSAAQFLMDDDIFVEFRRECARKIVSGINRASVIIENLLTFAQPLTELEMTEIDLTALLGETTRLIAGQSANQGVALISELGRDSLFVKGNASLLQQMFMNLFSNSLAAMPDGGLLRITADQNDRMALITVSDTGHGICDKDIGKVFDPFFSASPMSRGAGLGLAVSYSIVKHHWGNIELESSLGKGTTCTVRLPIVPADENPS
jgi:PAS domain S-box-containing protein